MMRSLKSSKNTSTRAKKK